MGNVNCVCGGSWQDKKKNKEREEAGTESPDVIKEKFSLKKQYTSTVNPSETVVSCYTAFLENVHYVRHVSRNVILFRIRYIKAI